MALKAQWVVTVEQIPGTAMEEYTQVWQYGSRHYTLDEFTKGPIFYKYAQEAADYVMELQMEGHNVVTLKYMWM